MRRIHRDHLHDHVWWNVQQPNRHELTGRDRLVQGSLQVDFRPHQSLFGLHIADKKGRQGRRLMLECGNERVQVEMGDILWICEARGTVPCACESR